MSYHIYTTKAFILSSHARREADRVYSLLTEDLGLIYAIATGVRKIESKLRGSLEPYTIAQVSLVKGADKWRITSALTIMNLPLEMPKGSMIFFVRATPLLKQLIPEELPQSGVYHAIERAIERVRTGGRETESIEIVMLLEILSELGYISKEEIPDLREVKENRSAFITHINNALRESQLT